MEVTSWTLCALRTPPPLTEERIPQPYLVCQCSLGGSPRCTRRSLLPRVRTRRGATEATVLSWDLVVLQECRAWPGGTDTTGQDPLCL